MDLVLLEGTCMEEEELKTKIKELIGSISSIGVLEYIYNFIKVAVTMWK